MGGLAIKTSSKIPALTAKKMGDNITSFLNKNGIESCILGSVGKKPENEFSGDIDIAVVLDYTDENIDKLYNLVVDNFDGIDGMKLSKGFKIMSVGMPFIDDAEKTAQIDFMFVNSIRNAKFLWHSPDYTKNESNFKGASRTDLLRTIVSETPVPEEYDKEEYFKNGDLKSWWQYSLNGQGELEMKHKTLQSKKDPEKKVKNPVTIKEDTKFIESDPDEIIKIIFGEECDRITDLNSFETEVDFIMSEKYKYSGTKDLLTNIFKSFIENWGDLPENEKAVKWIKENGLDV